jgi:hypothetical protein
VDLSIVLHVVGLDKPGRRWQELKTAARKIQPQFNQFMYDQNIFTSFTAALNSNQLNFWLATWIYHTLRKAKASRVGIDFTASTNRTTPKIRPGSSSIIVCRM